MKRDEVFSHLEAAGHGVKNQRGGNLDATILSPITGGASEINVYGAINGASVYRPNAMTGDPNHLGIMLIVPLLILTPRYLRLEKRHRMRKWLAPTIGFLLIVEATTLSPDIGYAHVDWVDLQLQ